MSPSVDVWKESLTLEFIYPSLPFLAPGEEKDWPTARAQNAPPGTLKRKNSLLGEAWQWSKVNLFGPQKGKQQ